MADEKEIERLRQRVSQLEAQNAALRQDGKVNRQTKNDVFKHLFSKQENLFRLYRDISILMTWI